MGEAHGKALQPSTPGHGHVALGEMGEGLPKYSLPSNQPRVYNNEQPPDALDAPSHTVSFI